MFSNTSMFFLFYHQIYYQNQIKLCFYLFYLCQPAFYITFRYLEQILEKFKQSFKYTGAKLWNSLPDDIILAESVDSFKISYKKKYFKQLHLLLYFILLIPMSISWYTVLYCCCLDYFVKRFKNCILKLHVCTS